MFLTITGILIGIFLLSITAYYIVTMFKFAYYLGEMMWDEIKPAIERISFNRKALSEV